MKFNCPHCGVELSGDAEPGDSGDCPNCGKEFTVPTAPRLSVGTARFKKCPSCGALVEQNSRFCSNCGTAIASAPTFPSQEDAAAPLPVGRIGRCKYCGKTVHIGDNPCPNCGHELKWIRKKATPSAVSTEKTPNSQPTNTQKNEKERQKFMELSDKLGELSSWGFHNVATEIGSTAFPGAGLLTGLAMFCFNPVWWIVGPIFATIGSRRLVKGDYRGARKALWWGRGINWAIVFAVIVGSRLVINSPGDSRNSTRGDNQKENNTYRKESERSSARRKANRKIDIYVETTDTTIDTLCMAIEHFRTDVGRYPTAEEGGLRALVDDVGAPDWCGPYIKKLTTDAWNRPFFYGQSNGVPMLISAGPDGVFQTKDDIASRYEQYRVHPDFVPHDESRLLNPHKRITKEKQTDQESVERVWNGDSP